MNRTGIISALAMCLLSLNLLAQGNFTYKDISDGMFTERSVGGVRSMNDGERFSSLKENKIITYSYATGNELSTAFEANTLSPKLEISDYIFSSDENKILLTTEVIPIYRHSFTAEYWIYDIPTNTLKKLSDNGAQQVASFSPDGTMCAFVRDNNLFFSNIESGVEKQITFDGKFNKIINGVPDWVYEEEFGFNKAYEWSPDSKTIAFYRSDEEHIKQYNMNRFDDQLYPTIYSFKYPKAGEENSVITIHTYNVESGNTQKIDVGTETDQYIPRIKWSPNGKLAILRTNRLQNKFDVLIADLQGNASKIIYTETDLRYVERIDDETITFIDGTDNYIVKNERNGYTHLYLYSISKGEICQITKGNWDVTQILGVDSKKDLLYYISCETSPLKRNLYSIKLNGKDKKCITNGEGTYNIKFSNDFSYFLSYFSNATTPNTVTLHSTDGKLIRTLEENKELKEKIAKTAIPHKEFFTFKTSEGIELYGYTKKPADFDSTKRYPILMTQYSGPGSQSVADKWQVTWEDALVQQGVIVACVDGRGTGFRGTDFKKCTYGKLGYYETVDQTEAAKYFSSLPYVDPERIAIYGWSFGGFMALNCILKANDVFKVAISVAPVTNWRYYDTIYTELYNGLPQDNPSGYDENSPIFFADKLKGKLLIAHGSGDDNVHVQNSMEMIDRLVKADKPFEMYIYPDKNHGMAPGNGRNHLMQRCIEFINRNL